MGKHVYSSKLVFTSMSKHMHVYGMYIEKEKRQEPRKTFTFFCHLEILGSLFIWEVLCLMACEIRKKIRQRVLILCSVAASFSVTPSLLSIIAKIGQKVIPAPTREISPNPSLSQKKVILQPLTLFEAQGRGREGKCSDRDTEGKYSQFLFLFFCFILFYSVDWQSLLGYYYQFSRWMDREKTFDNHVLDQL